MQLPALYCTVDTWYPSAFSLGHISSQCSESYKWLWKPCNAITTSDCIFSAGSGFLSYNTHAAVWIQRRVPLLILQPETASIVVSCVLCDWFLSAPYACRNCRLQAPFHSASVFPLHYQICWYLPSAQEFLQGCFRQLRWFPGYFLHVVFPCISDTVHFQSPPVVHGAVALTINKS